LVKRSDFDIGRAKIAARARLVEKAAQISIHAMRVAMQNAGETPFAVEMIDFAPNRIAELYNEKVMDFKVEHGFTLGEKINCAKIAALLVEATAEVSDSNGLFSVNDEFIGTRFHMFILTDVLAEVLHMVMEVEPLRVPINWQRDLRKALEGYDADTAWLSWTFSCFARAFGGVDPYAFGD
jgi:hypothetical protein